LSDVWHNQKLRTDLPYSNYGNLTSEWRPLNRQGLSLEHYTALTALGEPPHNQGSTARISRNGQTNHDATARWFELVAARTTLLPPSWPDQLVKPAYSTGLPRTVVRPAYLEQLFGRLASPARPTGFAAHRLRGIGVATILSEKAVSATLLQRSPGFSLDEFSSDHI